MKEEIDREKHRYNKNGNKTSIDNNLKCKWTKYSSQKIQSIQMDKKTLLKYMLSTRNTPKNKRFLEAVS